MLYSHTGKARPTRQPRYKFQTHSHTFRSHAPSRHRQHHAHTELHRSQSVSHAHDAPPDGKPRRLHNTTPQTMSMSPFNDAWRCDSPSTSVCHIAFCPPPHFAAVCALLPPVGQQALAVPPSGLSILKVRWCAGPWCSWIWQPRTRQTATNTRCATFVCTVACRTIARHVPLSHCTPIDHATVLLICFDMISDMYPTPTPPSFPHHHAASQPLHVLLVAIRAVFHTHTTPISTMKQSKRRALACYGTC